MANWTGREDFKSLVIKWANKLEIDVKSIYLRPMKNKWASCSTKGHLNFNDQLLDIKKELGEYVIVHELMHIRVPNHGPLWKTYMNAYLPEWENLDKELKKETPAKIV